MTKMRFSFDVDLDAVFAGMPDEEAVIAVRRSLLGAARVSHMRQTKKLNSDESISESDRTEALAPHLQALMLTLMAEANWRTEELPADAPIEMELPFEKARP